MYHIVTFHRGEANRMPHVPYCHISWGGGNLIVCHMYHINTVHKEKPSEMYHIVTFHKEKLSNMHMYHIVTVHKEKPSFQNATSVLYFALMNVQCGLRNPLV